MEGFRRTPEDIVCVAEIRDVMNRMRSDLSRPSLGEYRNRFCEGLHIKTKKERIGLSRAVGIIARQSDLLHSLNIPALILLHRQSVRRGIPDSPEPFFATMERVGNWYYRNSGVERGDIAEAKAFFDQARQGLGGETPTVWTLAELMDIFFQGARVKHIKEIENLAQDFGRTIPSKIKEGGALMGGFLIAVLDKYVHPSTEEQLAAILVNEQREMMQYGIDIPSALSLLLEDS